MARRRRRDYWDDDLDRFFGAAATLLVLGAIAFIVKYREQIIIYGTIAIIVTVAALIGFWFWRRSRKAAALNLDDDKILFMLRGMSPNRFEEEIATMFKALGFSAERVGGANDGGIDVVARKDGKRFYVQCKKFMTREVTPHDVRDFLGAITNINNPAEKGYFITTNKFTLAAEKAAEGNPRIELIDANRLVEYYKMAFGKKMPEPELPPVPASVPIEQSSKRCPRCGGNLVLRTAHKGEHAGHQFWGCSAYPNCKYLENAQKPVAVH